MLEPRKRPLIIAHRGASACAPENTLAAFRLAIEQGAHGIEFDVRLSKDGQPVVIHDATLERTGRRRAKVVELTASELASVDAGTWFNEAHPTEADPKFGNETIPSLAGTLEALKNFRGLIYIELKCRESEIERLARSVCELISGSPLLPQIIVKSFKLSAIPRVHFGCPPVKTAALFAPKIMRYLRKEKHLVRIAEEFGADHLSIHYSLVSRKLMKKVEHTGLKVTIWTADKPRWVAKGAELGLFAIITNAPSKLLEAECGE